MRFGDQLSLVGSSEYTSPGNGGKLLWRYQTGDFIFAKPAVVNGVVYFGSWDHFIYALTA